MGYRKGGAEILWKRLIEKYLKRNILTLDNTMHFNIFVCNRSDMPSDKSPLSVNVGIYHAPHATLISILIIFCGPK